MSDSPSRAAFEGIQSATILKPGDRVLLVVEDRWHMQRRDEARRLLSERFPEVEFTFINGVEDVVVKPGDDLYARVDELYADLQRREEHAAEQRERAE